MTRHSMSKGERTPEKWSEGSANWRDWARVEGKPLVDAEMEKFVAGHPDAINWSAEVLNAKREEIARKVAKENGKDVSDAASAEEGTSEAA